MSRANDIDTLVRALDENEMWIFIGETVEDPWLRDEVQRAWLRLVRDSQPNYTHSGGA